MLLIRYWTSTDRYDASDNKMNVVRTFISHLLSLAASLVTASTMQQCFDVLGDIYHVFKLLFDCCSLLEIKRTTTTF